jgi:Holliday junction resolvase
VKALLEADGWFVIRAPGSLGYCDLVALKAGSKPWMIEVKGTASGPFHSFGPKDRAKLLEVAKQAGGQPMLLWWPPNGEPHYLFPESWPEAKKKSVIAA